MSNAAERRQSIERLGNSYRIRQGVAFVGTLSSTAATLEQGGRPLN
jgi:hypothetical protein